MSATAAHAASATDAFGFAVVKRGRGQPRQVFGQKEGGVKIGVWFSPEMIANLDRMLKPGECRTTAIREAVTEMVFRRALED